jgi:hypothetical protein
MISDMHYTYVQVQPFQSQKLTFYFKIWNVTNYKQTLKINAYEYSTGDTMWSNQQAKDPQRERINLNTSSTPTASNRVSMELCYSNLIMLLCLCLAVYNKKFWEELTFSFKYFILYYDASGNFKLIRIIH